MAEITLWPLSQRVNQIQLNCVFFRHLFLIFYVSQSSEWHQNSAQIMFFCSPVYRPLMQPVDTLSKTFQCHFLDIFRTSHCSLLLVSQVCVQPRSKAVPNVHPLPRMFHWEDFHSTTWIRHQRFLNRQSRFKQFDRRRRSLVHVVRLSHPLIGALPYLKSLPSQVRRPVLKLVLMKYTMSAEMYLLLKDCMLNFTPSLFVFPWVLGKLAAAAWQLSAPLLHLSYRSIHSANALQTPPALQPEIF